MIVVDTNVLTYVLLKGEYEADCRKLIDSDAHWAVPSLWRSEFTNILTTYERVAGLKRNMSLTAFDNAISLIEEREYEIRIETILDCAARTQLSGYDATYVALAEDLSVPLYTYDKRVLKACPELARKP